MNEESKNYLGLDWGSVNVGVALAHGETRVALPYTTLKNDKNLLQRLGEMIARENIATVVIGIPSYINREAVEYEGEKLGRLIKENFSVNVSYQNEMFTTKIAQDHLKELGVKGISKLDDVEAARIILEEWLDTSG